MPDTAFGSWLRAQSDEERGHAMKFHDFIHDFIQDRGGRVHYEALPAPDGDFGSVLEVFERALENEQAVTRAIHDLYSLAECLTSTAGWNCLMSFDAVLTRACPSRRV